MHDHRLSWTILAHYAFYKWCKIKIPLLNPHLGDGLVQKKTRDKVTGEIITEIPHPVATKVILYRNILLAPQMPTLLSWLWFRRHAWSQKKEASFCHRCRSTAPTSCWIQETHEASLAQHSTLEGSGEEWHPRPREAACASTPRNTQRNFTRN